MAFGVKTNERPGTRCQVRYVRMSATKARAVLDLIRGKTVREAAEILAFTERAAAEVVAKALNSAVANAMVNDGQDPNELFVSACYADEGPTLKRWRPRARGRATRIRKRTCHITLIVSRLDDDRLAVLRNAEAARSARGGGRARTARDASEARRRRVAGSRGSDAADTDSGETTADQVAEVEDAAGAPFEGSALPLEDGSAPEGFEIKGNEQSKLYHVPGSRHYNQTKAEYYFATVEAAEAAGFSAPGGAAEADEATEEGAE